MVTQLEQNEERLKLLDKFKGIFDELMVHESAK